MRKPFFFIILYCYSSLGLAERVNIAVASNFTHTMKVLVAEFEKNSDHHVFLSIGSSGKIYAQIMHGAPYDLFFSADQAKPKLLEQQGLSVQNSRFTYAQGQLVLWSQKPNFLLQGSQPLISGQYNKLSIANPKLAPYGEASIQVLKHLGLSLSSQPKRVQGENISQTFQFVLSGNVDLGFVAKSQLLASDKLFVGSTWFVPLHMYEAIRQDAVLLQKAKGNAGALAFMQFVQTDEAKHIILSTGYLLDNQVDREFK